jgi:hypothetical protein
MTQGERHTLPIKVFSLAHLVYAIVFELTSPSGRRVGDEGLGQELEFLRDEQKTLKRQTRTQRPPRGRGQ